MSAIIPRRRGPTRQMGDIEAHPICLRLRQVRLDRGWPIAEVAARSGLLLQQIGAWELGRARPTLTNLDRWASAFDLTLDLR